jgi:hypothetical protein
VGLHGRTLGDRP